MGEKNGQGVILRKILRRVRRYWPVLILSLVLAGFMTLF